jgi:hypothetical protein
MMIGLTESALLLAQDKKIVSQVYPWLGLIVALAFVLGFFALWLRKKLMAPPDNSTPMGFTLKDLRAMHAEGHLSDEELARAEEKALARSRSHFLGDAAVQTDPADEPEDIGHLSTGSEGHSGSGTENMDESSDKNDEDKPRP